MPSRAASVTAVGRPRATSAAKLGPDKIAGTALRRAFGDHFAHEFLAAALDALGADDHRRARGEKRRKRRGHGAHRLRGNDEEDRVRARGLGEVAGDGDAVIEPHAGQEATLALRLQLSALAASCSHSVTLRPARAQVSARAVPQAPPPMTAM